MGDDVALLLRRAGFGPTRSELAAARKAGYAATLSALTSPTSADEGAARAPVPELGTDPYAALRNPTAAQSDQAKATRRAHAQLVSLWWLDRMTVADHQAVEKLLFFWHGHWATSIVRVGSPQLMLAHHLGLRLATDFRDMVHRMVVDPALVVWLDGHENRLGVPNENLARELMELFTLGIGHYTEADVKEAARALTGWRIDLARTRAFLDLARHDDGPKTILGSTGAFTAESLANLLLAQSACPRFIASRLWFRYASSTTPLPADLGEQAVGAFPAPMSMLQTIFNDKAFAETRGTLVKQPIEWLVGAMRQLGLRPATMPPKTVTQLLTGLERLGQRPFAPPSVGGWPAGVPWLTSAAMSVKLDLAYQLADLAAVDRLVPEGADRLTPESAAQVLCLDGWTNRTYSAIRYVRDPRRLLALGLVSPEYLVT